MKYEFISWEYKIQSKTLLHPKKKYDVIFGKFICYGSEL